MNGTDKNETKANTHSKKGKQTSKRAEKKLYQNK